MTTTPLTNDPRLPKDQVVKALASCDEHCSEEHIFYYPTIESLAQKVRSSNVWSAGEVFVFVESPTRFIVMMQVAPSSCEMLTVSQSGFCDVLTAYRIDHSELVSMLTDDLSRPER
ncbi:hypothetical protein LJR129_005046 [Acidovorax sp. LjRoot129]|uniref:hypothetical protein n=1 Tax=unclassified Acidovorax TaxID=2684926 RepID=UPI003ECC2824